MLIGDLHNSLGNASGGLGPVFRWVWASLIAVFVAGLVYMVSLAVD
ncbi:MAG TPA: hypothetical protein VLE22_05235 [Bryobacteraceae bacterium]|jgi:hypothetical protein|nr:hypothetical protein [Bryobacteraceae bacterium]